MILKVFYLRQLVYTVSTLTEATLGKHVLMPEILYGHYDVVKEHAACPLDHCNFCRSIVVAPWARRGSWLHMPMSGQRVAKTHAPCANYCSWFTIDQNHYYRSLVDILISCFLSGMATRTWSRNTRPAHWIIAILSFDCGCLQAK